MLPSAHIDIVLEGVPGELRDIVQELRSLIASAAPQATEVVRWRGLVYYDAERGGPVSAGICVIKTLEHEVQLGFIHGAFLPDPHKLLKGDRKAKRFLSLRSYEDAPWEALKELIAASARFDPRSLAVNRKRGQ